MSTDPSTPENDANLSALGRELLDTGGSKPSGPWVPPTAEELHKLLPEYEILKMLGRGGMGAVYMGKQISLDRPVAIKILSNALEEADASFAERFKNEAKAMGRLTHPGIVAVHDFGETDGGLLYIVMEYVEGTDVARMIAKEGRLHTEHAMAITAHVCDALGYAHERGIIHRDIKPANIMVGYDGVVKVADFGLAKMTQSANTGLTQSGMAMGTLHYMAPEALMLGSAVDHRADIYAVGVMLYQMLAGKLPQGMFELPSLLVKGLDPRYDDIIAKALREDREVRYQGIGEMRRDLDGILTQPVVKVEEAEGQAPAALSTQARPQRSGGQRSLPPQQEEASHTPQRAAKSAGGGWVWALVGLPALAIGAWLFFGSSRDLIVGQPLDLADVTKPATNPTPAAPATNSTSAASILSPAEPMAVRKAASTPPPPVTAPEWPSDDPHFRQVGRFKYWHSEIDSALIRSLDQLKDITDVKQLYMGGDVKGGSGVWVVLRQNGEVITSDRPGEWARKNIARICPGAGKFYGLIDLDGRFEAFVPDVDKFPDRKPPPTLSLRGRDAILGPDGNFLLTTDGGINVWGASFDGVERPPNDLEWSEKPAPAVGRRFIAISHADGNPSIGATVACQLEDQTLKLWSKSGPIELPPKIAALKFRQFQVTRDYLHGILDRDRPVRWKIGDSDFRTVPGITQAESLHAANGKHAVFYLTSDGRPHFVFDGPGIAGVLDPVLPYIKGARPDLISVRVHWNGVARKRIAWVLWFDGEPTPEAGPPAMMTMPSQEGNPGRLDQMPEFRTRIANYQKARHAQLSDLTTKYRNALTSARAEAAKTGVLANVTALDDAIIRAAALADEIEKNLNSMEVKPLPVLPELSVEVPQRLKDLRAIFDRETVKIEGTLLSGLDQSLATVQASLTQAANLEASKAVEDYRKQMMAAFANERQSSATRKAVPSNSNDWIDLIAAVDPVKDVSMRNNWPAGQNRWEKQGTDLVFLESDKTGEILFPGTEDIADFDIRVAMTRESGTPGIDLKVPVPGGATPIWIGHQGLNQLKGTPRPLSFVKHALVNGQRTLLEITVRSTGPDQGIVAVVDGKRVIDWKGDYQKELGIVDTYASRRIGLWIYGTPKNSPETKFRFHEIMFRPL